MPRGTSMGNIRAGGFHQRVGDATGSQALRNEGRHSTTESSPSVPSCPTRFSLGQRHPLSLQRFATLRDYFKKLGGTRRASVASYRCLRITPKSHYCEIFFYAVLHAGTFLTLFNLPDILGLGQWYAS